MNVVLQTQFYETLQKTVPNSNRRMWMSELLASCPSTGEGVHNFLFISALKLHRHFPDKSEIARLLGRATEDCGREVTDEEIWNAIDNSQPIAEGTQGGSLRRPKWPNRNGELIEAIKNDGPCLERLCEMSPVRRTDDRSHTEEIIDVLFPANPLLCAAPQKEFAKTRMREEWRGFLSSQQFIVPSPMASVFGKTKTGQDSMRTLANTGARRFLVVEFDQGDFDEHAALLTHLAKFAPLVMVVHSGNKSLHGWFYCHGQPEETVERFFRYAVSLGADHATWTRCQLVRVPDGIRDNGRRQQVMFFNPKAGESK